MKNLSRTSRFAKRLGIETKAYKDALLKHNNAEKIKIRREAFLTKTRNEMLEEYPETEAVFEVQDTALRFYSDVLIATPTSLNTNKRNELRAKATALDCFDFLDKDEDVPAFSREGRHAEASLLKAEELQTLRQELYTSFEENARVRPELRLDAHARYAKFSTHFFKNEEEAINLYPELRPLISIKKQAERYYSRWVLPEHLENTVKDCMNRALQDIARHIPLPNAEEIKLDAETLRSSWIGTQRNSPQKKASKKHAYQYQGVDYMRALIGRNGIQEGWWPYSPDLLTHTDRITNINEVILKEQWVTSFNTEPKDTVLEKFPKLSLLYNKLDSARDFYKEKMAAPFAEKAAQMLVQPDFDRLLKNEPLLAVSEIPSKVHGKIMERILEQMKIEGRDANLVEEAKPFNQILKAFNHLRDREFNDINASNEEFPDEKPVIVPETIQELPIKPEITLENIAEQIRQLKEQLQVAGLSSKPLEELLQAEITPEIQTSIVAESPTIKLETLRSTAPDLQVEAMFTSTHLSKTVPSDKNLTRWDIPAITEGLKAKSTELATLLLGENKTRENNQLRFGTNKGSLIVTIEGEKQGLWYDHQTGEGGNLLQLIQKEKNMSFKEALNFAGNYLALTPEKT